MIESRAGKYSVVALLLALATILSTSRPKKPHIVYPLAAMFAAMGGWTAWRVKVAPPMARSFPLGDPMAFIAAVPAHVARLEAWARAQRVSPPPHSVAAMDEWLWDNRESLGADWQEVMHGLVAAYGQALGSDRPNLVWLVRDGEPSIGSSRSVWPGAGILAGP